MWTVYRVLVLFLMVLVSARVRAQQPPDPAYERLPAFESVQALRDSLQRIAGLTEPERTTALNTLWADLRTKGQVPFAVGDTVVWLYRGTASSVAVAGDHTGWRLSPGARRVGTLPLWMLEQPLPDAARIDYKLVINGSSWILDPANPLQAWSGFGPNSELRMPAYAYPRRTVREAGIQRGTLSPLRRLYSPSLRYEVGFRTYLTPHIAPEDTPALLFVTDGHEYANEALGSMLATLDNLAHAGTIRPILVVFVDPREPGGSLNRRQSQYVPPGGQVSGAGEAPNFVRFLADELRPHLAETFTFSEDPAEVGVLGTSLGGLFAAYAITERPDVFGRGGIQSPAFWAWPDIYARFQEAPPEGRRVYLTQGLINDGNGGIQLRPILSEYLHPHVYIERPEGHSWAHWRALLPEMLESLFPALDVTHAPISRLGPSPIALSTNPAREQTTLDLVLDAPSPVHVQLFDLMGRLKYAQERFLEAGATQWSIPLDTLSAGTYVVRVSLPERRFTTLLTRLP